MNRLWAPWRITYIRGIKNKGCIFCAAAKANAKKHYVVFTTGYSQCMLNIFPYNNGHLMVSPIAHKRSLAQLTDREALDLFRSLERARVLLKKVLKPHGYNIGINISAVAGAGIPGHLHVHIVPRWKGDTNFMPVFSDTKVISQSLDELYTRLRHADTKRD